MNIWLSLDETENKNVNAIRNKLKALQELNEKEYEIYFKVVPTHIGTKVIFICEELSIEKDITNYSNW
jgi:ATP/maltotriose-dependent transcriptional regulator MalT